MTTADVDAIDAIQGESPWRPTDYLWFDTFVAETIEGDNQKQVVAFLATRAVYLEKEFEVLNLVVSAAHRRMGYARALLEMAIQQRPGIWFLEARTTNEAAITLYKSLSFKQSGRRKDYYQNPTEDGIVMTRKP